LVKGKRSVTESATNPGRSEGKGDLESEDGDEEDLELWREYKDTGNPAVREKIVLKYASFVKYVAGRMAINLPSNVEYDDLVSYGIFGLIDAIDKFDADRAIKFKTYAKTRIRGAILDELRVLDWTPRSIRQKSKQLERAYAELETKLGREATDEEICDYAGIDKKDLHKMFDEAKQGLMISLDEGDPDGDTGVSRMDFLHGNPEAGPEGNAERAELKKLLAQEIAKLSERERLVITLYYFEHLTSKEIGKILGVSDSRISQLHTKAVLRLRGKLAKLRGILND
jgi:RNA polymerase sigma factor for flagellar operon FliA